MSWIDRAHREHRNRKIAEQVLMTPEYQEVRKKDRQQATLDAYYAFCFVACEFLEAKHRYGHDGMMKFLDFANQRLYEMDEDYFVEKVTYYRERHGLDVLNIMMCEFEEGIIDDSKRSN